jgi:hypothetical protein
MNNVGQTNVPPLNTNAVAIAAGDDHTLALLSNGSLIAWGNTNFNQTSVPAFLTSVATIGAGSVHSLAAIGQPFARTVTAGESAILTSGLLGKGRASYQWQLNGTNILGATNAALAFASASSSNSGIYQVIVSNALGVVTGQPITLTVQTPFQFDNTSFSYLPNNGAAKFTIVGGSGINPIVIYASSNLVDWEAIFTNIPTTNPINFTDAPAILFPRRFYRAIEQP